MKLDFSQVIKDSMEHLEVMHCDVYREFVGRINLIIDILKNEIKGEDGIIIKERIDNMMLDEFDKHMGSYMSFMDKIKRLLEEGLL